MSHHKHFTISERKCLIRMYCEPKHTIKDIAKALGKHISTIHREINRLEKVKFNPELAQKDYENKRKNSRKPLSIDKEGVKNTLYTYLEATQSPEQICETVLCHELSFKTVYNYIDAGIIPEKFKLCLRHKGRKLHKYEKRGKMNVGKSIHDRPKEINKRVEGGHWEGDTIVSGRGDSKGCFFTITERKSRLVHAVKCVNRTAKSINVAIRETYPTLPKHAIKSITVDRGKEFAGYKEIESEFGIDIYFADPYRACQRGTNENANGLLREFYRKKTNLTFVDEDDLKEKLALINNRPRKCLGWATSLDVFLDEVCRI